MKRKISEEQIKIEAKSGYRPLAIDSGITLLPISELGDREFELLAYFLVKAEINNSKYSHITDIALMQGVSERGRDCVLYKNAIVTGLIQCKKYQSRITKPQVLKEILKFLLFSHIDNSILPNPEDFEYNLYISSDLTEPALLLFHSYKNEIENEIKSKNIERYLESIIEEFESFYLYKNNIPISYIYDMLRKITIRYSNINSLTERIYNNSNILDTFFNIKKVIDLESADKLIRSALDDYGLKYLTDDDLISIKNRIGSTKKENRVNLGFVDFFGYSKDFFKFIKGKGFNEVVNSVSTVNIILDKLQLDFITSKIHEEILIEITNGLLKEEKIHVFSVSIAAPYLVKRLSIKIVKKTMSSETLKTSYPEFSRSKSELISEIAEILFNTSERVMNKDYGELVGTPEDIQFKIRIFEHIHHGFNSIDDAKYTFSKDIKVIQPVLDKIEDRIGNFLSEERSVIIKSSDFLDDKNEVEKFANTIKEIE